MEKLINPKTLRLELNKLDCVDKFGYMILRPTQFNTALERSIVDAVPVTHGEWWPAKDGYYGHAMCSNCHKIESHKTDFCPNCGVYMIEDKGDCEND